MPSDFHLKLGTAKGESKHESHEGEIEISSFNWGLSNQFSGAGSGGGGHGAVVMQEIHFVHFVDSSSPTLMKFCASGDHMPGDAVLTCRKPGGKQEEYITIVMKQPFVTSVNTSASTGGQIQEQFTLAYKEIDFTYKPQTAKGTMGGAIKFGHNLETKVTRS
jgi:type VI secretion system secreted protein Hcp